MISTDRKIFEKDSPVALRQIELAKKWKEVHIIVFAGTCPEVESEMVLSENCWAYSTKSRSKWFYVLDAIRLGRFIISKRVITNITTQDPFFTANVGTSLKKQFPEKKLEIQVHTDVLSTNYTYTIGNRIRKILALSYIPKADTIRTVSNRIKDSLIKKLGVSSSKIEVRPIPVEVDKIKNAPIIEGADLHKKYPQFDKIVLMASRIEPEKNIGLAIKAWVEVLKVKPKTGLVIIGEGSEFVKLKKLAESVTLDSRRSLPSTPIGGGNDKERGNDRGYENDTGNPTTNYQLPTSIVFEPWVNLDTLYSYYKTADLFVLTSLFEGYGMTLVEAQASGCKIVSTDVGVAREVGAVIAENNPTSVAEKIISCL